MSENFLTIHSLTALPWNNLNRDDRGLPKQVREGGAPRGRFSPQSLKRAARLDYENAVGYDRSFRSRNLPFEVVELAKIVAQAQGVELDVKKSLATAKKVLSALTEKAKVAPADTDTSKKDKELKEGEEGTTTSMTWLGADELDTLVQALVTGSDTSGFATNKVGSLAIAAYGRMTAADPDAQVEAAVSFGPAITTHAIVIEIDYFSAVEDLPGHQKSAGSGSGHLGQAFFTSGVYYRSHTYDRRQLRRTWSGFDSATADEQLHAHVLANIRALPSGKQTNTAANIRPALIVAEEQASRTSYEFHTPVQADGDGGYLNPSINSLLSKAVVAKQFEPRNFGDRYITGTMAFENPDLFAGWDIHNLDAFIDRVVAWVKE